MILSLDPGYSKIGWSIISANGIVQDCGFLNPLEEIPKSMQFNQKMNLQIRRLVPIFNDLLDRVSHVAWEIVPSFGAMAQRDLVQSTAMTLKVLTISRNYAYQSFTPQSWHKEFIGKGKCTKQEVKEQVINVLKLNNVSVDENLPFDVFDAIAIGMVAQKRNEWTYGEWDPKGT